MADSKTTTDVAFKSFTNGSLSDNSKQALDWIRAMEFKRD